MVGLVISSNNVITLVSDENVIIAMCKRLAYMRRSIYNIVLQFNTML